MKKEKKSLEFIFLLITVKQKKKIKEKYILKFQKIN